MRERDKQLNNNKRGRQRETEKKKVRESQLNNNKREREREKERRQSEM